MCSGFGYGLEVSTRLGVEMRGSWMHEMTEDAAAWSKSPGV